MGKHEPMTAKAIANRIKAKGLQKIKYYCEMCKKQCRDDNGFKCHIMSESHQRQALIVSEDPEKFVSEFSKQFMDGFMYILRTRYRTKRVLANTIFQEYIKERDHIHMNGTRWTTLTDFARWLGENGFVKIDDSERGIMVTYIDRDPETLRRQEIEAKRTEQAREAAIRNQKEIERQMEATKKLYKEMEKERPEAAPVEIVKVPIVKKHDSASDKNDVETKKDEATALQPSTSSGGDESSTTCEKQSEEFEVVERPLFKVQAISLKTNPTSSYKPPPQKRKVSSKSSSSKKKVKLPE